MPRKFDLEQIIHTKKRRDNKNINHTYVRPVQKAYARMEKVEQEAEAEAETEQEETETETETDQVGDEEAEVDDNLLE